MSETPLYEVRRSSIHNTGLFAARDVQPEENILEYKGEKITKDESNDRGLEWEEHARDAGDGMVYIFDLNEEYDIDGNVDYNDARYMNHSCDPNCEAVNVDDEAIWISAVRPIKQGDELTFDYGYDLENFFEHPCVCGSANCIGYIVREDLRSTVRRLLRSVKERLRQEIIEEEASKSDQAV